ncbi:hypothetical protein [Xanthobacter autotrophicus]|nr:hypothetical protein [Xanthobacter autotrophicus]MDI4655329.1 hypothetical protein [Xanthobacter autotrophicus]
MSGIDSLIRLGGGRNGAFDARTPEMVDGTRPRFVSTDRAKRFLDTN